MSNKAIKIHELINTCVLLSQRAGTTVRKVQNSGTLNTVQKGLCSMDVCTEADLRIQKTISHNLRSLYPNANIVCEEDDQEIPAHIKPCIQPEVVSRQARSKQMISPEFLLSQSKLRRKQYQKYLNELTELNSKFLLAEDVKRGLSKGFQDEYDERDLTFWVDPLDGSSGLAEGHTEHLTCIIGVSINKRPLVGIVHKPFSSNPLQKNGRTYVGMPDSGLFTILYQGGNYSKPVSLNIPPFNQDSQINDSMNFSPRICGSHNKNQHKLNSLIQATRPKSIELVAGSGNKFVHMTDNRSDFYLNFVPGFKNWDMCGSEAILAARFGIVTDAQRQPIFYSSEQGHTLKGGIIAAKSKRVLDICSERIEQTTGISLEMNHQIIAQEADEMKKRKKIEVQLSTTQQNKSENKEKENHQVEILNSF